MRYRENGSSVVLTRSSVVQEREDQQQKERQRRRTRMEDVSRLVELGFSRTDAARALHRALGDVDKASAVRP